MSEHLPLATCPVCGGMWLHQDEVTLQKDHIYYRGKLIKITKMESKVLCLLINRKGALVHKNVVHTFLYGDDPNGGPLFNTLNVYITHIRKALKAFDMPYHIDTVYDRGWILNDNPKS